MDFKQITPLHTLRVERIRATINRAHIFVHSLLLLALLYYRASWLFFFLTSHSHSWILTLTWFLLLTSELTLSFIWLLLSAYRWRPVSRTAFPERLSDESQLPGIDVFICTADPAKEPPLDVMNTVVSALALDYPTEKLWVYLSDDGGADITLYAMRKAFSFAMVWLPFCRKYGVRTRCPNAYFSMENEEDDGLIRRGEFWSDREKMKAQMTQPMRMKLRSKPTKRPSQGGHVDSEAVPLLPGPAEKYLTCLVQREGSSRAPKANVAEESSPSVRGGL